VVADGLSAAQRAGGALWAGAGTADLYLFTPRTWQRSAGDLRNPGDPATEGCASQPEPRDPASFLNVYDPDQEVQQVSAFMANGMTPAQVSGDVGRPAADVQANEGDWLLQLFGGGAAAVRQRPSPSPLKSSDVSKPWPGLFKDEYNFARPP